MFAKRKEFDVAAHDHVVRGFGEDGAIHYRGQIHLVAARNKLHRFRGAVGSLGQALALWVLAQLLQDGAIGAFKFCVHMAIQASPRYSNMFRAVSLISTLARRDGWGISPTSRSQIARVTTSVDGTRPSSSGMS